MGALLDRFEVPAVAQGFIREMQRMMRIQIQQPIVSMASTTFMSRRIVEQACTKFTVGEIFQGEQQLGGAFQGFATWGPCTHGSQREKGAQNHALTIEKRFGAETGGVVMVEILRLT